MTNEAKVKIELSKPKVVEAIRRYFEYQYDSPSARIIIWEDGDASLGWLNQGDYNKDHKVTFPPHFLLLGNMDFSEYPASEDDVSGYISEIEAELCDSFWLSDVADCPESEDFEYDIEWIK